MTEYTFTDSVEVRPNGEVILPKEVREALGVSIGDHVTFIVEDHAVYLANTAI